MTGINKSVMKRALCGVALSAMVAGCGGGGGGAGGGFGPGFFPEGGATIADVVATAGDAVDDVVTQAIADFDPAMSEAEWRTLFEFNGNSRDGGAAQLALINAEAAFAEGHTGANEVIAILDAGTNAAHQDLRDQISHTFGDVGRSGHGAHVASIAAAAQNEVGVMGVAHGASLHVASIYDASDAMDPDHWAAATRDAARAGAIAQNTSWRFDREVTLEEARQAISGGNIASGLAALSANGRTYAGAADAAAWANWLSALREFQDTGVIVKSLSNDLTGRFRTGNAANLHAALPTLDPSLLGAWLTVANVSRDASGNAMLHSAPCAEAAEYCLAVDGQNVYAAGGGAEDDYITLSGTSMAAPQVSGAVAVLASAFPGLKPEEIATRLLATADNSFFATDGVTDFGAVQHGYSTVYGHGAVDLRAALAPVGGLTVPTEATVSGARIAAGDLGIAAGAAFGDALDSALEGRALLALDALDAPFAFDAGAVAGRAAGRDTAEKLARFGQKGRRVQQDAKGVAHSLTATAGQAVAFRTKRLSLEAAEGPDLASALSFGRETGATAMLVGETNNAHAGRIALALGGGVEAGMMGFVAENAKGADLSGAGMDIAVTRGPLTLTAGFDATREQDGLAGLAGTGAMALKDGNSAQGRIGLSLQLTEKIALSGEIAAGVGAAEGTGFAQRVSGARMDAYALSLTGRGLFGKSDRWSLGVSQPARISDGALTLRLPVGRTESGEILYETTKTRLSPSGRQIDFTAGYSAALSENAQLDLSATWSKDKGHVAGAEGYELLGRLSFSF